MIIGLNVDINQFDKGCSFRLEIAGKNCFIERLPESIIIKNGNESILLEGDLYYYADSRKTEYLSNKSTKYITSFLTKIIKSKGYAYCRQHLEGSYSTVIFSKQKIKIIGDCLKRKELFYFHTKNRMYVSSQLLDLVNKVKNMEYDQNSIALMLATYYQYIPARNTIYKGIYALGPDEYIEYSHKGFEKGEYIKFKNIEKYGGNKLSEYAEILNRAILSRSSNDINIANSTGGWDSTYIITVLVELLGRDKVVSSTFDRIYKNGMSWNIYEKTRARGIAKHFGIKYMEVPINFNSPKLVDIMIEQLPALRSSNIYIEALSHYMMYQNIQKRLAGIENGTVFTGEASDSLHNFGFSQYMSFFHQSYGFKEYGDKMKSYLYSPEFFKKVVEGTFKKDAVFEIWKNISGKIDDEMNQRSKNNFIFKYLAPIIFGQHRIPFEKISALGILNPEYRVKLMGMVKKSYFDKVISVINEKNFYSCLTYLYKVFHLQGPTLKMIPLAAELNGFKTAMPFLDMNLVNFLEKMPSSWGRSLELNNTKYPLKAVARANKAFPIDIVESGIHSYPVEVDQTLTNAPYNLYFNSTATGYFKQLLSRHTYREILDDKCFDLKYIDKQINYFLNDRMDKIDDYNLVIRIINFVAIGWY